MEKNQQKKCDGEVLVSNERVTSIPINMIIYNVIRSTVHFTNKASSVVNNLSFFTVSIAYVTKENSHLTNNDHSN